MLPIEVVVVLLWLIFGFVGLVRRFPVELGATIGLTAMLFTLDLAGGHIGSLAYRMLSAVGFAIEPSSVQWVASTAVIAVWVLFMYGGQTLSFTGVWPPNPAVGVVIDVTTGLFNGWLVIGTWWFITDALGYPIQRWGWFGPPLSDRAENLLALTPPALIPESYSTIIIGGFLVFLIALRVFR